MIYFRVDANPIIGLGHMTRCLSIANELLRQKKEVMFVIAPDSDSSVLKENNMEFYQLRKDDELGWNTNEFIEFLVKQNDNNIIVFMDTYRINEKEMLKISKSFKLVYLDDSPLFDYPVNSIINYNLDAKKVMYSNTRYKKRDIYIGPLFFPTKDDFIKNKKSQLSCPVNKVLITSSSTDACESVLKILLAIKTNDYANIQFYILIGSFFSLTYIKKLKSIAKTNNNIHLLSWGQDMPKLLSSVDLLISPGSTVMMESLVVGTPCMSFSFVDNQIPTCLYADNQKIAPYIGDLRHVDCKKNIKAKFNMMLDSEVLKLYFNNFKNLFDGNGCKRIYKIISNC